MAEQLGLFGRPRARRTDPETSHEAAASVSRLRESQEEVLHIFRAWGPMTDVLARRHYFGTQSESGFRTRRAELVASGDIIDTGERIVGPSGRRMIVWAAKEA